MTYKNNNIIIPEIFASIVAVVAGILIYVSRIGFDNYGVLVIKSIFISFFLIFTPHILNVYIVKIISKEWYFSKAFLLLVCIMILVIAGQINIILNINLSYLFVLLGGFSFFTTLIGKNKRTYNQISIWLFILFFLIGSWVTTAYFFEYYHPLMKEKIITGAWAHRDSVWGPSIAGMFKTYGTASTGIDGLVPIYYHILSYFIYGSISGSLGVSTITFFNINVPILIIPIFFLSFLYCVREVSKYYSLKLSFRSIDEYSIKYWLFFSVLFMLPLPYQVYGYLGGERYQYIGSPSYSFALLLTFIFLSIIFSLNNLSKEEKKDSLSYKIFVVVTVTLFFLVISLSKVSFMFVLGSIYGYVFLRLKYYNNVYHVLTMAGFIGVVAIVYFLIINTETFLKNPHQVVSKDVSLVEYILYILPSLFYIVLKIYSMGIRSLHDFYDKIKTEEILDIEILILLIIILFPLPFQYFKGIQKYLAYIFLLSHLSLFIRSLYFKNSFSYETVKWEKS